MKTIPFVVISLSYIFVFTCCAYYKAMPGNCLSALLLFFVFRKLFYFFIATDLIYQWNSIDMHIKHNCNFVCYCLKSIVLTIEKKSVQIFITVILFAIGSSFLQFFHTHFAFIYLLLLWINHVLFTLYASVQNPKRFTFE